ncbi:MAG: hypothetical protein RI883_1578 [Bacteroidota bacterium]|jgi:PAS domain S-box-containing protein
MSDLNNQYFNNLSTHQNEYFDCLVNSIPHIISFIDPINFRITYINKVEEGYDIDKVIGMELFDFILPQYVETYRKKINEVKANGKAECIETAFHSFRRPNGLNWYKTTISPVKNPDGSIQSLLVLSEDITGGRLLEIENDNKSERLKAIINNTSDIICSIDSDYKLIEFNSIFQAIVFNGFDVNLEPGMEILQYIDPKRHDHLTSIYERVFKGETCVDIESYETARMNTVYFETSFHPIYDVDKIIRGISIFSKNITERIKTENKIINALKEKEVLLSEIHHRIKNNLAMVSSMLHLQEMNIENNEAKAALALSRKRIKTTALIHELLYKNETFHDIRLNEFLNELFMLLRTNENIDLVLIGEEVSFKLNTALPLGLMLNEIMLNSFKHSYKNALQGKTKISSQIEDNYLIIEYCDCQGNFPNTVDFANSSTTGLTLIHTFAEQLNGSIQLISNEPPKYLIQIPLNEPS